MEEGAVGVIVNLTVEDKDDPTTGAWRAAYTIINGNPGQSFEIHTNPQTNEGMLSVVKVRGLPVAAPSALTLRAHRGRGSWPRRMGSERLVSPGLSLLGLKRKRFLAYRCILTVIKQPV